MSPLVSSTRLMPVTFPTLRAVFRPNSQNGNPSKINPEKVACFSSPNPDHQLPSFHQQSTTTSPPKHHIQPPVFAKTPAKTGSHHPQKIAAKHPILKQDFGPVGDDYNANHSVLIPEIEDLGAPNPRKVSDYGERPRRSQAPATKFVWRTPFRLRL